MSDLSSSDAPQAIAIAGFIVPLVALAWLTRALYATIAPLWLVPRGEYARARVCYERVLRAPLMRHLPSTQQTCAYGVALCLLGEGKVERSLVALRALPYSALPPPLRFGVSSLLSGVLLLLERDADEAADHARRALELSRAPDLFFALAHAYLTLGDEAGAERAVNDALTCSGKGRVLVGLRASIYRPVEQVEAATDLLRGWYFIRRGQVEEARPLLVRAARSPLVPPMTEKARALLAQCGEPLAPPAEPPPSLATYELTQ